jgi:hypothetical protein
VNCPWCKKEVKEEESYEEKFCSESHYNCYESRQERIITGQAFTEKEMKTLENFYNGVYQ